MKFYIYIILLIFIPFNLFAQRLETINKQAIHFQLKDKKGDIDFIVVDTVLKDKKPIFLFCQGSMPMPLFVDYGKNYGIWMFGGGIANFDIQAIQKDYHLVVISMPATPVVVPLSHLDKQSCYVLDTAIAYSFNPDYEKADYLDNYVDRAHKVLQYLQKQDWVEKNKTIVFGHSQGSHIAPHLALKNKSIQKIGLSGFNPLGRIDQMIRQERQNAESGKISWETAENNMNYWYQTWTNANNEEAVKMHPQLLAWKTFSQPMPETLLKLQIPIYVVYGTKDITAELCDLLPLVFISHHKTNLTIKRKYNVEHNYFEVGSTGIVDYEKPHWNEVMTEFLEWASK